MPNLPLMGHLVLGYPTLAESVQTAQQYLDAGIRILELQIPFSDPSADGFVISHANHVAIKQGVTVDDCLGALSQLRHANPDATLIVMTYTNKVFRYGVSLFAEALLKLGINNIIVPDLPVDSPQYAQIAQTGLQPVPVLAANTTAERIDAYLQWEPAYWYLMADFKITGQAFTLNPALVELVEQLRKKSTAQIGVGFGISTAAHLQAIAQIADFGIVGSALITANEQGTLPEKLTELVG